MKGIQTSTGIQAPANSPTGGNDDEGDVHERLWTQLEDQYLDNAGDDMLSEIVENGHGINQYLLLKQLEKVRVVIGK